MSSSGLTRGPRAGVEDSCRRTRCGQHARTPALGPRVSLRSPEDDSGKECNFPAFHRPHGLTARALGFTLEHRWSRQTLLVNSYYLRRPRQDAEQARHVFALLLARDGVLEEGHAEPRACGGSAQVVAAVAEALFGAEREILLAAL